MKGKDSSEKVDLEALQKAASEACALLKVMANPDRLLLLCQMTQGEFCVSDLDVLSGIKQPTLSQQLTVLREEQLVTTRREGKKIYYTIASDQAMQVLQLLYTLFCKPETHTANDH